MQPAASPAERQKTPSALLSQEPAPLEQDDGHAYRQSLQRAFRRQDVNDLLTLREGLVNKTLSVEEFQAGAKLALSQAHDNPDFFTRRIARLVLYPHFEWPNKIQDACLKEGELNFCRRYFSRTEHNIVGPFARDKYHTGENYRAALQKASSVAPDQETVIGVASFGHNFARRSRMELKEGLREKEPVEFDLELARLASKVLSHWEKHGCLEIRGKVEDLLTNRPVVHDGEIPVLDLTGQGEMPAWPGQQSVLKDMNAWDQHPEELERGLKGLVAMGPEGVNALVARASHPLADHDDARRVGNALVGARSHPELKRWLEPHLPALSRHVTDSYARNNLCNNNLVGEGNARLVRKLVGTFPELVTPEYFRTEVMSLALADELNTGYKGAEIAAELWKERPELRDLAMQCVVEQPEHKQTFFLDHTAQRVMEHAVRDGWKPSPEQTDWMASWLYIQPGDEYYLHSSGTYKVAVKAAASIEPRALAGVELPDRQGKMVPLVEALLDQVAHAGNFRDNLAALVEGKRGLEDLLLVLKNQTDPAQADRLHAELKSAHARAGSVASLDPAAQVKLAVLSHLPGGDERLGALLAGDIKSENQAFKPLLDRLLRAPARAELLERLKEPELPASEVMKLGTQALELSLLMGAKEAEEAGARLTEALSKASPVALHEQGSRLLQQVLGALKPAERHADVRVETRSHLAALCPLLKLDADLRRQAGPLVEVVKRLDDTGWEDRWRNLSRQFGEALADGFTSELEAGADPGKVLDQAFELTPEAHMRVVLETWSQKATPQPQMYGSPRALLENGLVSLSQPEFRDAWISEAGKVPGGPVEDFIHERIAPQLFESEVRQLATADSDRAGHLQRAEDLSKMTYVPRDQDPVADAFRAGAQAWEKELLESLSSRRELLAPFYRSVLATAGEPRENWNAIKPMLAHHPAEEWETLAEAVGECRRAGETFTEQFRHYRYFAERLGPDQGPESVEVFRDYNVLREEGMEHEPAVNRALQNYLNPGKGDLGAHHTGIDESGPRLNVGGVLMRKRTS